MNVYDFDGTIYASDCSVGFAIWCMNRHPTLWLTFFPKAIWNLLRCKIGKLSVSQMQRRFFSFLTKVDDFDDQIERFWDQNEKKIAPWYLAQKKPDDLIISASPTCIIGPIAKRLGVHYMATEYDREFGVLVGNVMSAREKARYMIDQGFPVIENFYSDSLSDTPLALCAEKAHLISEKATKISDWPPLNPDTIKEVRRKIDTGWKIHL